MTGTLMPTTPLVTMLAMATRSATAREGKRRDGPPALLVPTSRAHDLRFGLNLSGVLELVEDVPVDIEVIDGACPSCRAT
jgi:hypothetical protein